MTPDKDFEIQNEDVSSPRTLIQRLTKLHKDLRRVVLKVVVTASDTPKKVNGIKFDSTCPPPESPEDIADLLTQMALDDHDNHQRPPHHYEAWCETAGTGTKNLKYIRFRVDPDSMGGGAVDETELETLMRAAMTFVGEVSTQNKELHQTLLEHSRVLQATTVPYKDALEQMGEITSNAFKQTAYALFLVMDTQRQDRELEIDLEKWKETMGLAKQFVPKAIRQKIQRMMGISDKEEEEAEEEEDETGDENAESSSSDEENGQNGKEKKNVKKTPLSVGCQAFGASLESQQWPKIRKALKVEDLERFERIINCDESAKDEDLAKKVNLLRKTLDTDKMKLELMKIFTVEQLTLLGEILNRADDLRKGGKKKKGKRSSRKD